MANPITALWNSAGYICGTLETGTRTMHEGALILEKHVKTLLTIEEREAARKLEALNAAVAAAPTATKAELKKAISL